MSIITIISDFGIKDPYVAILKGQLLSKLPTAKIIDISHSIRPFNIPQGAYILHSILSHFPPETMHIVSVGIRKPEMGFIMIEYQSQYFIGWDNGLFSLVFNDLPISIFRIDVSSLLGSASFPEKDIVPHVIIISQMAPP